MRLRYSYFFLLSVLLFGCDSDSTNTPEPPEEPCPPGDPGCNLEPKQCMENGVECSALGKVCQDGICVCASGQHLCSGVCVVEGNASCGKDCVDCTAQGFECNNGYCACPPNTVLCDGQCKAQSDSVCGLMCNDCASLGMVCGLDGCICPSGSHICGENCVQESDSSCGADCVDCTASGQVCRGDTCTCGDNLSYCNGACVASSDTACGNTCEDCTAQGLECHEGTCKCEDGEISCGGQCVQESDKVCGESCEDCTAKGQKCHEGTCKCEEGKISCGGQCVQETDKICGDSCTDCTAEGLECHGGQCTCPIGMARCNNECIPETDQVCGNSCVDCSHSGLKCHEGSCVCPNNEILCDGTCKKESDTACGPECLNCEAQGFVCWQGECICRAHTLEYTVYENKIADIQLKSAAYSGEKKAAQQDGAYRTEAVNAYPYQRFEVKADAANETELSYKGTTIVGERLAMFVWSKDTSKWEKLDSEMYQDGSPISLHAVVKNADYVQNGVISVIVAPELQDNGSDSMLMTGDTQNYTYAGGWNADGTDLGFYRLIMQYTKEQYLNGKVNYFHHVGDMTSQCTRHDPDLFDKEFKIASDAHQIIDEAGCPSGASPGNHDYHVVTKNQDNYVKPYYHKYFPASRYENNFWYGGSYDDNWNSYTLITIAGRDFVFLNLGYDSYPTDWGNDILKTYRHRIGVVCAHSYLGGDHKFTNQGKIIYDQFVLPNDNVKLVLCGHVSFVGYYNREITPKRNVMEIVVDHTGMIGGSQGYLRWIQFKDNKIINTTYSPYLDHWRTAEEDPGDEWTEPFVLPDSSRKIETLEFHAQSRCLCKDNSTCGDNEVCNSGVCECAPGKIALNGQCLEESDTICGTEAVDCTKHQAVCKEGRCACPDGKVGIYDRSASLMTCDDSCGNLKCGEGALCMELGYVRQCRCATLDGQLCEAGGKCVDRACECPDELVSFEGSIRMGCIDTSPAPSKIPSQINMAIASETTAGRSAMAFNWVTDTTTTSSELIYSTQPDLSDPVRVTANVRATAFDQMSPNTYPDVFTPVQTYKAVASQLVPNQTYYYKLGNAEDGYTEIRQFEALEPASENKPFSFLVIPTTALNSEYYYHVIVDGLFSYIKQKENMPSFLLHTGNIVNHGWNSLEWQYFLHAAKTLTDHIPIMAAVGHHDGGSRYDVYYTHFLSRLNYVSLAAPSISATAANTVYSFEYGNALFIVLNSKVVNNDIRAQWNNALPYLASNSTKKWKILVIHVPPYSAGSYFNVDNLHGDSITKAGIDLVLSGYENSYFRTTLHTTGTDAGDTNQVIRVTPESGAGTTYVITGSANGTYQGVFNVDKDTSFNEFYYQPDMTKRNYLANMYGMVNVTDDFIEYTEYDSQDGSVVDSFKITKSRAEFDAANAGKISRVGVNGMPVVGNELKTNITPQDATATYQWERSKDGKTWSKISGQTGATYQVTDADLNDQLRCTVTGSGSTSGTVSSLPTKLVMSNE